jgi:hypothetical protein
MENRLKKQLALIKARALEIAGHQQAEGDAESPPLDDSREILDAVVRTGAVVRGAEFDPQPRRFPWWWRRRETRRRQHGFEGEFQRILNDLADGEPVAIEDAVRGTPRGPDDAPFYLIEARGGDVDSAAVDQAARFASFRDWPPQVVRTRIGAHPLYGVPDSIEIADGASPNSVLFLDIETAGLSANTYVFLVGLMYWVDGEFHVEQTFARDYTEEPGLLHHVRSTMERFNTVVTYNGASFDLPFIRTRMAVHRIPDVEPMDSVDLLHASRRVFRPELPNCRLVTVERHLRGVEREDDIPSRFIPRAYHEFVRSKDARIMRNVVYHNRMDVFTMAMILNHLRERAGDSADDRAVLSGARRSPASSPTRGENSFAAPSSGDTIPRPNPPHEPF